MIKIPSKLEIGLGLLSLMKSIYTNSTANIVNGETLKASPLKPGIRQNVLCLLLCNIVLEFLSHTI